MSDVFSEVDEQLRSERLRTAVAKGWPLALALAAAILGIALAVWGWTSYRQSRAEHASDIYAQGLEALAHGDAKTADARFGDVTRAGSPAYTTMALMQQSGLKLSAHKDADAVALLDQAAKVAPTPVLADSARLKAALILTDRGPLSAVESRLAPLTAADRPFRWLAVEARGLARLQAGRTKEAHGDFAVLSLAQDVSESSRARARAAMSLIDDGTASSLPGLVKAALALPPAPTPGLGPAAGPGPGPAPAQASQTQAPASQSVPVGAAQ